MSEEQLRGFLEAVKADAALRSKLNAAANADAVVTLAKEAGFVITAEELKKAHAHQAELSEEDVEGMAGGAQMPGCGVHQCYSLHPKLPTDNSQ